MDSNPPKVGVVIPAYNCGAELERALASLMAQTYSSFRFIVVDDGSDDDLAPTVARFGECGACIRQPQAGPAAARNHALRLLDTDYIAFLDADDEWLPAKLERQMAFMEAHPDIALTCTDYAQCGMGSPLASYFSTIAPPGSGWMFERIVSDCFICTPTVMVRREALRAVGGFYEPLMVSEDHNLWIRIAARFPVSVLTQVLAIRHLRPASISACVAPEQKLFCGLAALEHAEACDGLPPAERQCLQRELCRRFDAYAASLILAGDREGGRPALRAALRKHLAWRPAARLAASYLPAPAYLSLRRLWRGALRRRAVWSQLNKAQQIETRGSP